MADKNTKLLQFYKDHPEHLIDKVLMGDTVFKTLGLKSFGERYHSGYNFNITDELDELPKYYNLSYEKDNLKMLYKVLDILGGTKSNYLNNKIWVMLKNMSFNYVEEYHETVYKIVSLIIKFSGKKLFYVDIYLRRMMLPPYKNQYTLQSIGDVYGLTRERVRQILIDIEDSIDNGYKKHQEQLIGIENIGLTKKLRKELEKLGIKDISSINESVIIKLKETSGIGENKISVLEEYVSKYRNLYKKTENIKDTIKLSIEQYRESTNFALFMGSDLVWNFETTKDRGYKNMLRLLLDLIVNKHKEEHIGVIYRMLTRSKKMFNDGIDGIIHSHTQSMENELKILLNAYGYSTKFF